MVDQVAELLPEGKQLYLVGGAVRDQFLGRPSTDFDFVVDAGAIEFARRVANQIKGDFYVLDEERDAARVLLGSGVRLVLDFVGQRGASLEEDLKERDFTVNALGLRLGGDIRLFDPCNGVQDLRNGILRVCQPDAIEQDPVRALRAVRLAAQFKLKIESLQAIKAGAGRVMESSAERVRDEFMRLLMLPKAESNLRILDAVGVLGQILPEMEALKDREQSPPHQFNVWEHTLKAVAGLEKTLGLLQRDYPAEGAQDLIGGLIVLKLGRFRGPISDLLEAEAVQGRPRWALLLLALLLHDVGKGPTQEIGEDRIRYPGHEAASAEMARDWMQAMKFSRGEIEAVGLIIGTHKRVTELGRLEKGPGPLEVYRYFRELGELGIDLGLHSLADLMGRWGAELPEEALSKRLEVVRALFEGYFERREEFVAPPSLLDGNVLVEKLKMKPGPRIGEVLEALREAQVQGLVATGEEALAFARQQAGL